MKAFAFRVEEPEELFASINTTPLVDVMLVLLIIFLITIPVAIEAVPVSLPKTAAEPDRGQPGQRVVSVTADGRIFLGQTPLPVETVVAALRAAPLAPVQVRGDAHVPYAQVARVLAALRTGGIHRVVLATDPRE